MYYMSAILKVHFLVFCRFKVGLNSFFGAQGIGMNGGSVRLLKGNFSFERSILGMFQMVKFFDNNLAHG